MERVRQGSHFVGMHRCEEACVQEQAGSILWGGHGLAGRLGGVVGGTAVQCQVMELEEYCMYYYHTY